MDISGSKLNIVVWSLGDGARKDRSNLGVVGVQIHARSCGTADKYPVAGLSQDVFHLIFI